MIEKLFSTDLPSNKWVKFKAKGYEKKACGVIFRPENPPCCGVPVGSLGTGCIDVEAAGVYGFVTVFNPFPRKPQLLQPFLGIAVNGKTFVLTTRQILDGGLFQSCTDPAADPAYWQVQLPEIKNVSAAKQITYWGHYPIADLEFDLDAPIQVGLRVWAPFIPGDLEVSNIPGAVFDIYLRNITTEPQHGTLAFTFPGPDPTESHSHQFLRKRVDEPNLHGVAVTSAANQVGYVLAFASDIVAKTGRGLNDVDTGWSEISNQLPPPAPFRGYPGASTDSSASLATYFDLDPGICRSVRILLTWFAPNWRGEGAFALQPMPTFMASGVAKAPELTYQYMYTERFQDALDAARELGLRSDELYKRLLAWQEAIFSEEKLPSWLQDALVNNLALITECGLWAAPREPVADWPGFFGLFGFSESPRGCPHVECIPCSWYGNFPLVFFFPELARSSLRGYLRDMRTDGAVRFTFGPGAHLTGFGIYDWQQTLNGFCFIDMVDRLWQRTDDLSVLHEFYDAVKAATIFTVNLNPGPDGVISMPKGDLGAEWWEHSEWYGMCTHLGGLHLAMLEIAQRMASTMNDAEFTQQCQAWLKQGQTSMEMKMWDEDVQTYLLNYEPELGKRSSTIMANQFDGQWTAKLHGLAGIFNQQRVKDALKTIQVSCVVNIGSVSFAHEPGQPLLSGYGIFPPEMIILAMTYLYEGYRKIGLEVAYNCLQNLVLIQRHPWDLPNMIRADNGNRTVGTDYYQNMILWALPAALEGIDLRDLVMAGGLVDNIIKAGNVSSRNDKKTRKHS